ncbi:MAG: NADH-quinone oxidoreductase subunit J [Candidatus Bathyarchaeia archaeon]
MIPDLLDIALLSLLILTMILSLLTIEHKNIVYSLLLFFFMNITLGIIYYMLGAPLVALIQFAVFCGAIVVLFLLTGMLTRGGRWK